MIEWLGTDLLPPLRKDILIEPATSNEQGHRQWRVVDPVQNRFFLLGDEDVALLSMWSLGSVSKIKGVLDKIHKDLDLEELKNLYFFLKENYLFEINSLEYKKEIFNKYKSFSKNKGIAAYLTHRFPLFYLDSVKESIFPYITFLKTKIMMLFWWVCTAFGLYFSLRQMDLLFTYFKGFLTFEGVFYYISALIFIKFFHEMGHAHTADKYGCQLGRLGIATYFGIPMFYTELDSVSRLNDANKKMRISASGVAVEIYIAGWCTFFWAFMPSGIARDVFFVVGTSSWLMSLVVNLNPFAKFDGYYLLSDYLRVDNLQQRSIYTLNRVVEIMLLGFSDKKPELVSWRRITLMCLFGLAVKIYQIIIIFSVAYVVYNYVNNFLVIIVCASLLYLFLFKGYLSRLMELYKLGAKMASSRKFIYIGFGVILVIFFFLPLSDRLYIPGVVQKVNEKIVVLEDAVVSRINLKDGDTVKMNDVIIVLTSGKLEFEIKMVMKRLEVLQKQLDRIAGSDQDRAAMLILIQEINRYKTDLSGLKLRQGELVIKSSIDGVFSISVHDLAVGQSVSKDQVLGFIVRDEQYGHAFLNETELSRFLRNQDTYFYPDNGAWHKLKVRVTGFDDSAASHIEPEELSTEHGGPILTYKSNEGWLVSAQSKHKVRFIPEKLYDDIPISLKGTLVLKVKSQSLASGFWNQFWRIMITELRR